MWLRIFTGNLDSFIFLGIMALLDFEIDILRTQFVSANPLKPLNSILCQSC